MKRSEQPDPVWSARRFAVWWLRHKPLNIPAHNETMHCSGTFHFVVLYRHGPFQVQFISSLPWDYFPPHRHPNVESVEVWIAGNDSWKYRTEKPHNTRHGMTDVALGELHHATPGNCGIAWFSVQKWHNGVTPTSIELDWEGPPLDADHAKQLDP